MPYNILMKRYNGSTWDELYPKTDWANISSKPLVQLNILTAIGTVAKDTVESSFDWEVNTLYFVRFVFGNNVANITIDGIGVYLGANPVNTTTFTLSANTTVLMYYDKVLNRLQITGSYRNIDASETYVIRYNQALIVKAPASSYPLLAQNIANGKYFPIYKTNTAGDVNSGVEFSMDGPLLYDSTTTAITADTSRATSIYAGNEITCTDIIKGFTGGVSGEPLFLVGNIGSNGGFKPINTANRPSYQVGVPAVNSYNKNYLYWYVGYLASATTVRLEVAHPCYYLDINGKWALYTHQKDYLQSIAKGETSNKTLTWGGTFKVLETLANGTVNERIMTMPPNPDTDLNNYLTGVSGSGNETVTFTRQGLSSLTWEASHGHTIEEITGLQSVLGGKSSRVILTGQLQNTSYRRSVIALCELTNNNPGANSYSVGTLTFHRTNGLSSAVKYDFAIEKRYNTAGFNLSQTVLTISEFIGGIRPCTFVKNGIKYGGIEIFFSDAELSQIEFHGTTNFEIFGLDYYIRNTSTPLDTEVNNSLVFDDSTNIRVADTFKVGNNLVVSEAWVTSNTRSSSWTPTWSQVSSKPVFATVATSGSYNDLSNKPTIPNLSGYATEYWTNTQLATKLNSSAKGETANKTLTWGGTFKVLQTLADGSINERTMTMPSASSGGGATSFYYEDNLAGANATNEIWFHNFLPQNKYGRYLITLSELYGDELDINMYYGATVYIKKSTTYENAYIEVVAYEDNTYDYVVKSKQDYYNVFSIVSSAHNQVVIGCEVNPNSNYNHSYFKFTIKGVSF